MGRRRTILASWLKRALRASWLRHAPGSFLRHARPTRAELGAAGEELAARAMLRRGYRLRGRRVATREAEVDLWATRDDVSWVLEVKTGRVERAARHASAPGLPGWDLRWRPALSLAPEQRLRLEAAARLLARAHRARAGVALVEVLVAPGGEAFEVRPPSVLFVEASLGAGEARP